jgi:hypothetical protein
VNRKAASIIAALLVATTASVAAADVGLEKKRLNKADMALAKRANLKLSDLAQGWKRLTSKGSSSGSGPSCPGYSPDLSRFTITGEAEASFQHPKGFVIFAAMQVFPSRTQAAADFRTAAKPSLARCLTFMFEGDFAKGAGGTATTTSSRMVKAPRIGERAAWYRLVGRLRVRGNTAPVHMDVLAVQQGRMHGTLMFVGVGGPIYDQAELGHILAARMR